MTISFQAAIVFSVALGFAGCQDSRTPSAPITPTPVPTPTPPTAPPPAFPPGYTLSNVTLSGVVFEETAAGRMPIERVSVYCEPCTGDTLSWILTDSNGYYSFAAVWTDPTHFPTRISIEKAGYGDPDGLPTPTPPNPSGPGWREVVVNGDTRFDMQLVRQ